MKSFKKVSLLSLLGISSQSFAATTMAELIADINFTDVITAVFSIGALVIAVDLAQIGYTRVRRHVKGAAH